MLPSSDQLTLELNKLIAEISEGHKATWDLFKLQMTLSDQEQEAIQRYANALAKRALIYAAKNKPNDGRRIITLPPFRRRRSRR